MFLDVYKLYILNYSNLHPFVDTMIVVLVQLCQLWIFSRTTRKQKQRRNKTKTKAKQNKNKDETKQKHHSCEFHSRREIV